MTVEVYYADEDKVVKGKPGDNLLSLALDNDIDLDHACGGVCACSTCHVKIAEGEDLLSEQEEGEFDQLDDARDIALNSRLSCQATILEGASGRIVVMIPAWNVNFIQEPH